MAGLDDLNYKGKIVFGFGFNEIFEIMKDPTAPGRLGREGLNEHVHNHLFTVLGRMGLIGLFIYFVFQFNLLKLINTKELFIFFTFVSSFINGYNYGERSISTSLLCFNIYKLHKKINLRY